ncbi:hypothetical protein QYF36_017659 [Acer negundo]|nr:hypothetical protein QYF36_004058 [Acer negundo]KAK4838936.1 hypothetical protein QYF36_017659 [Acer negundo]
MRGGSLSFTKLARTREAGHSQEDQKEALRRCPMFSARWFGGASSYGSTVRSSSSKRDYDVAEPPRKLDLDGLTPFEKNFYVESPSLVAMSEKEVKEYRL